MFALLSSKGIEPHYLHYGVPVQDNPEGCLKVCRIYVYHVPLGPECSSLQNCVVSLV